jgi:tetratricopeptide (TPR) repeat protein
MADCQIYGVWPGGHHLTNVVLHGATAVLLFLALLRLTGDFWPSALVAAVFAIHPLHVESVAWISERKDVLSGFCFMLALAAYAGYARSPFSMRRYLAVLALLALGLMAKPMLVTLPCVLLLLDWWPLRRFEPFHKQPEGNQTTSMTCSSARLIVEKIPLLVLSGAACWLTIRAQRDADAFESLDRLSPAARVSNALVAYASYIRQSLLPFDLAAFYPYSPAELSAWKVLGAIVLLTAISLAAFSLRRSCPYLLVGWCWFLGMLVPVIGLIQVGAQAMADRYMYLPQIGLGIALAWGAADCARNRHWNARACHAAALLLIAGLMACSWKQTSYWFDGETLWTHALSCTTQNSVAHSALADVCLERGRPDAAIPHYEQALEIDPVSDLAHSGLGIALEQTGRAGEAVQHLQAALAIKPDDALAEFHLGKNLAGLGRLDEAAVHFEKALQIDPTMAAAHHNLGKILTDRGRFADAIHHFEQALKLDPHLADAFNNLGIALGRSGRPAEAVACFERALKIKPDLPGARHNLNVTLAKLGRLPSAKGNVD